MEITHSRVILFTLPAIQCECSSIIRSIAQTCHTTMGVVNCTSSSFWFPYLIYTLKSMVINKRIYWTFDRVHSRLMHTRIRKLSSSLSLFLILVFALALAIVRSLNIARSHFINMFSIDLSVMKPLKVKTQRQVNPIIRC